MAAPSDTDDEVNSKYLYRTMTTPALLLLRAALTLDLALARRRRRRGAVEVCEQRSALVAAVLAERGVSVPTIPDKGARP